MVNRAEREFISWKQRKEILRGPKTLFGNREHKKTRKQIMREQRNNLIYLRGTKEQPPPPPPERALHITEATKYHQSNDMQYYLTFAIVIQAMMFKQMLVQYKFFCGEK